MFPRITSLPVAALALILSIPAGAEPPVRILQSTDGVYEYLPQGYSKERTPPVAVVHEPTLGVAKTAPVEVKFGSTTGTTEFSTDAVALETARIDAPEGTSFYGTGEVTGPLLRNDTSICLWNTDNYNWRRANGARLYQSHPWVLAVRPDGTSFGVLFDTTWRSWLTCGDHDISFSSQGPAFRVLVLDGRTPLDVLQMLARLTGTMPLPPRWAIGFQQCRYSYYPDARVREIADGFRSRRLPCDVIWMDIDYMDGFRIFTFDPQRFPDPAATNRYLHDKRFHSIWMIDPGVKAEPGYAVYDSGSKAGAFVRTRDGDEFHGQVWPGKCAFPDFTSPSVREWWGGLYADFLAEGVDGVWNDMNEPAVFDGPDHTMPEGNQHAGGADLPPGPHLEYHNIFGMQMSRATREGIRKLRPDARPFVLTRSSYIGGQRFAATWTGDNAATWEYLKASIPMSLNLGLSGQPFSGPDIGGYSGKTAPDLFGHWMGLGAFYPFSRAHKSKGEPDSEPWCFGPEIEQASRIALRRRYRLLPYFYTLFHEASVTGAPIMRPAFFADPADPALRGEQQAFLLGADLLIVPRWAEKAHLPKGEWRAIDLLQEKTETDAYQPDVRIRPGAIVPLGKVVESTEDFSIDPLTLVVAPDASGHADGWVYHDEGDGYGYQKGRYAMFHYTAERSGKDVVVKLQEATGDMGKEHPHLQVIVVTGDHTWEMMSVEAGAGLGSSGAAY